MLKKIASFYWIRSLWFWNMGLRKITLNFYCTYSITAMPHGFYGSSDNRQLQLFQQNIQVNNNKTPTFCMHFEKGVIVFGTDMNFNEILHWIRNEYCSCIHNRQYNIFRSTRSLCYSSFLTMFIHIYHVGVKTRHDFPLKCPFVRISPLRRLSNANVLCFLWCWSKQAVAKTGE